MANFNKWMAIGRLTRDPESHTFNNGGMVCRFGFAVSEKRKDPTTGQYVDDPLFIDCSAFNSERRKMADLILKSLRKGSQIHIIGRLRLERWQDTQTQQQRQKISVIVEDFQFLDPAPQQDGQQAPQQGQQRAPAPQGGQQTGYRQQAPQGRQQAPQQAQRRQAPPPPEPDYDYQGPNQGNGYSPDDDIPF